MRTTRALLAFLLLTGLAGAAGADPIRWTTQGAGSVAVANALGEPGADSATAAVGAPITFSRFTDSIDYAQLGSVLTNSGVSAAVQAAADFIAFDVNGTIGGFEGTNWTFDDGAGGALATSNNFGALGTGIVFNGDISDADYTALFGESTPFGFVGFVLFDLGAQGVNVLAPGLTVTLEGIDLSGAGEPDVSGLGILVPEPSVLGLFSLALAGLAGALREPRSGAPTAARG